jgi:hypothetical protein
MSNFSSVSRFANTTVSDTAEGKCVRLYETDIFEMEENALVLRHGGHKTATTKRRINQALDASGFDWKVFQQDGDWFVDVNGTTAHWDCRAIRFVLEGKDAVMAGQANHI